MKIELKNIILCAILVLVTNSIIQGAEFDALLDRVSSLRQSRANPQLISLLESCKSSSILEDLRLFLLGEALKATGREDEALGIFERVIKKHPGTLGSRKAEFYYVVTAARLGKVSNLSRMLNVARGLPTPYQRGRALESLFPLISDMRTRGEIALESLRAYHSESSFYKTVPESKNLLLVFLSQPEQFNLARNEWIEVLIWASREEMTKELERTISGFSGIFGASHAAISQIIKGDVYRHGKNTRVRGVELLTDVINRRGVDPDLIALAHQLRGDAFHFLDKHSSAINDYKTAISRGRPPVNVTAAKYRLMRSAFEVGDDPTSIKFAEDLCHNDKDVPAFPYHLYEMGLKRYDSGKQKSAVPFFKLLAEHFPGHYRADDGLGYSVKALGPSSKDGKSLLKILEKKYPNSFFIYWVDPSLRRKPFAPLQKFHPIPGNVQKRFKAWKVLLKGPFADMAIEEIKLVLDEWKGNLGVYRGAMEAYRESENFHQLSGCGERLLRVTLDSGKNGTDLPRWAWQGFYPKPFWTNVSGCAKKFGLDPYWILSIMREESHFNPKTLSRSNAMGLMQILPSTGKWIDQKMGIKGSFKKNQLWDIPKNISFGTWYLSYLKDLFKGDLFLSAAAYNGGQGNILRKVENGPFGKLPVLERLDLVPLPETRDYYKKVMGSWWCYKRLYS